jgi:transposase-like protein
MTFGFAKNCAQSLKGASLLELLVARELRRQRPRPTSTWHLDEMAVLIAGRQFWLRRAVDDEGEILDLLVHDGAIKLQR